MLKKKVINMFCPLGHALDSSDFQVQWYDIQGEEGVQIIIQCPECDATYDSFKPIEEFTEV